MTQLMTKTPRKRRSENFCFGRLLRLILAVIGSALVANLAVPFGYIMEESTGSKHIQRLLPPSPTVLPHKQDTSHKQRRKARVASVKKTTTQKQNHDQLRKQNQNGGGFIHTGKTGGSSLSILLRNGCHSYMPHPCRNVTNETMASKLIESYYHVPDFGLLSISHHDFIVMTVRDPFDRTVSAFCHEHLRNRQARGDPIHPPRNMRRYRLAYQCFATLEEFVGYLGPDGGDSTNFFYPYKKNEIIPDSCQDFARAALHGRIRLFHHFYFGYQHIKSLLDKQFNQIGQILYVIRQEHLWDDWREINRLLGQSTKVVIPQDENTRHRRNTALLEKQYKLPVQRELSATGRQILCRALQQEYEGYFWFLQRASNIQASDLRSAVARSKTNCPELTMSLSGLSMR